MRISKGHAFASFVCAPNYKIYFFLAPTSVLKKSQMRFVTWTIYRERRYYASIHVIKSRCAHNVITNPRNATI